MTSAAALWLNSAMAKARTPRKVTKPPFRWPRRIARALALGVAGLLGLVLIWTLAYRIINPPTNAYMLAESRRLGGITHEWVPMGQIAPVMARAAVAAEDANFCLHWGLDVAAIRDALDRGRGGASTISQQVVKNVFLWHGRSWARKSIEALWTPLVEALWPKRRILEIYLNVAEFDAGIFGVQAAAQHYFGVDAADLTATQAARLAAILPAPKERSAANPGPFTRNRAAQIVQGAETIAADGRAACFQG